MPPAAAAAGLDWAVAWCGPAPTAWVEGVWTNRGQVALALWPWTDTDTGPQHDAVQIESVAGSAPLIAPRKHAAARWCALAPGKQHAVAIDLAAWQRRLLLAPGRPRSDGRLAYQLAYQVPPGDHGLPARLPACGADNAPPMPATAWAGRLVASIAPAPRPAPHDAALSADRPSAAPCGSRRPAPRPG